MRCDEFRELISAYLSEELEGPQRIAFRRHLRNCESCRAAALAEDPTLLFAIAEPLEPDPVRVERCVDDVLGQIRRDRIERRLPPRRRPWLAAAAAVMVTVAGAAGWQLFRGGEEPQPVTATQAEVDGDAGQPPPHVEVEMPGEGVRVYQFAQEDDADTAVYYIVNPDLES